MPDATSTRPRSVIVGDRLFIAAVISGILSLLLENRFHFDKETWEEFIRICPFIGLGLTVARLQSRVLLGLTFVIWLFLILLLPNTWTVTHIVDVAPDHVVYLQSWERAANAAQALTTVLFSAGLAFLCTKSARHWRTGHRLEPSGT